jgi:pyridoxamine 5'-phosphate oxidase family protein
MTPFTTSEVDFITATKLARLATANLAGEPHISPVTFRLNDDGTIDVGGGSGFATRKKWRDMQTNPAVAIVFDDVLPPWRPRCVEARGRVEIFTEGGRTQLGDGYDNEWVRIHPRRITSFGIADGGGNRSIQSHNVGTRP